MADEKQSSHDESRRDFLRLSALTAASVAAPLLSAGDARAQGTGSDVPVKIGYLPITDASALLVAHAKERPASVRLAHAAAWFACGLCGA